jgi:hypothetical protein
VARITDGIEDRRRRMVGRMVRLRMLGTVRRWE